MNVLLAYSALHRAAALRYPTPEARITIYLENASRSLSIMTINTKHPDCPATVAALLLMASMGSVFSVLSATSCHAHLKVARKVIGTTERQRSAYSVPFSFLIQWLTQLECMRSSPAGEDSGSLVLNNQDKHTDSTTLPGPCDMLVPFHFGATSHSLRFVKKVADMARVASKENNHRWHSLDTGHWMLPKHLYHEACSTIEDITSSLSVYITFCKAINPYRSCRLGTPLVTSSHYLAALIHLHRRVLGLPSSDPAMQALVGTLLKNIGWIQATPETNEPNWFGPLQCTANTTQRALFNLDVLFPMITAGFETESREQKDFVLKQCKTLEPLGLPYVRDPVSSVQTSLH